MAGRQPGKRPIKTRSSSRLGKKAEQKSLRAGERLGQMVDIDKIMDMLDWNNPPEVQEEGRALAREVRCINVFLQPGHPGHVKNVWDNCAIILSERSDQTLRPYLYELFKWLEDMSWPGAICVYNRLKSYHRNDMFEYVLDECINEAKALDMENWLSILMSFVLPPAAAEGTHL